MDTSKGLAAISVAILLVAGVGAILFYAQAQNISEERDELAMREMSYEALMSLESDAQDVLLSAIKNLSSAAVKLSDTGLNGTDARAVMNGVMANITYGIDVVTIDTDGVIIAAEPAEYQSSEGTDISDQAQVQRMLSGHIPVMSEVFVMVEGFVAADLQMPVFDGSGMFIGSLSVTLDMEGIISDIVEAHDLPDELQVTCLQDDGLEVYDTDAAQIGKNLFTDAAYENYTETLAFMHEVLQTNNGHGTYQYYRTLESQELVTKEVYWNSFGMYGTTWTLMVIYAQ